MKFKPEDFYQCDEAGCTKAHEDFGISDRDMADIANKRLAEMLAEAPTVSRWANYPDDTCSDVWFPEDEGFNSKPSHTAKLVCIEKIGEEK